MAIVTGTQIEITLNMLVLSQQVAMVFQYLVDPLAGAPNAVQIAEAWWNHVKVTTRGLAPSGYGSTFKTVRLREMNNLAGDYAEYDIPVGEQIGTRATGSGDLMPPFAAVGVRLVVGSRLTRPGQKRIPFMTEGDTISGVLQAAILTSVTTWCNTVTVPMLLGAPAAATELDPIVVRKDPSGFVTAYQRVTGFLINGNVTTQNSRKYGRGA